MANGFRTSAEPGRKEQMRALQTELKNTQAAARISQMMLQQVIQNNQSMQQDLGKAFHAISELQYKLLATEKIANLDPIALTAVVNDLRLADFNDSAAKEDAEKNLTVGDVVKEDSIVILTSVAADPDKSIFRSKISLKEANVPDLTKGLLGREVGAKVVLDLAGVQHTVELLGIRQPPVEPVAPTLAPVSDVTEPTEPVLTPVPSADAGVAAPAVQ
jgi:hypothetical protein